MLCCEEPQATDNTTNSALITLLPDSQQVLRLDFCKVKDMLTLVQEPLSLEMTMDNDRDTRIMDFVSDDSPDADPGTVCQMKELHFHFEQMMTVLNDRERLIINLRYGFDGEKKATFADIGKLLGVTRERARQLEAKAILKLRRTDCFKEVQRFFEE